MSVNVGGGQFSTAFGGTMVFGKLLHREIVIGKILIEKLVQVKLVVTH